MCFGISRGRKAILIKIKKQKLDKQIFTGKSLTMEHKECFNQMAFLGSSLSHPNCIKLLFSVIISSFLGQILYLNSFRQLGGRSKVLLTLLFHKSNHLKIIHKSIFSGDKNSVSLLWHCKAATTHSHV